MATDSIALERSLEPEKRFGHRLKLIWNPKSYGHRLKLIWNLKSALATDSIALERSLEPEKRFGHRLKLLSSGLWNSKFALAVERVYAMALSCAFV